MSNPDIKNYGFGTSGRTKEYDDEVRKQGQEARKEKARIWTKEKCIEELDDILQCFKRILREDEKLNKDNPGKLKQESIRDLNSMMNRLLDFMKYLYPVPQTNVNVNVETTVENVIQRLKNYKQSQVITEVIPSEIMEKI